MIFQPLQQKPVAGCRLQAASRKLLLHLSLGHLLFGDLKVHPVTDNEPQTSRPETETHSPFGKHSENNQVSIRAVQAGYCSRSAYRPTVFGTPAN